MTRRPGPYVIEPTLLFHMLNRYMDLKKALISEMICLFITHDSWTKSYCFLKARAY